MNISADNGMIRRLVACPEGQAADGHNKDGRPDFTVIKVAPSNLESGGFKITPIEGEGCLRKLKSILKNSYLIESSYISPYIRRFIMV